MKQVLCILPNCSEEVGGVKFTPVNGGMLSEPISDDAAARLCSIPGYAAYAAPAKPNEAEKTDEGNGSGQGDGQSAEGDESGDGDGTGDDANDQGDDDQEHDGEQDDVVPLADVLDWARPQKLPVVVLPGAGHFFHGYLVELKRIVGDACR